MSVPPAGDDWVLLDGGPLPTAEAMAWAGLPRCGAVVTFAGTVRDSAEGRPGVTSLEYEAYTEQVEATFGRIVAEARRSWPELGRLAVLHRHGRLEVGEVSVVVVVSAPHRPEAFEAARWCIDELKASAPIWKRETWSDGEGWGTGASDVRPARAPSKASTEVG